MTTPTRQMVLDALLVERIDKASAFLERPVRDCLRDAAYEESIATNGGDLEDYWDMCDEMDRRYDNGTEILGDWRLVQSKAFDWDAAPVSRCLERLEEVESQDPVGYVLATYGGYIPTKEHTRYVGLAPRQEVEES